MLADASALGDDLDDWDHNFKKEIHGVIMVTANSEHVLERTFHDIKKIFRVGHRDATIAEVAFLAGHTRPGSESGHEQSVLCP